MTFEENFEALKSIFTKADPKALDGDLAIQINLTGEGEGRMYAAVKNGVLSVEPYEYYDRDVALTCDSKNFISIAEGKLDPVQAYMTGKLKVDGDIGKALKLKVFTKK
ncbi:MAG: SCP2 sterol-binding domain-containing protein [Oscillospiraceae bacterium]|nr:SCP2 sterol-binding domain-containing protein [Oscillospiraceae bacterium]